MSGKKKTVVFLANSEHGQANIHIAVASSILLQAPDVSVHFVSFPSIQPDVEATADFLTRVSGEPKAIQFHALSGLSHSEAIRQHLPFQSLVCHGWGFWNAVRYYGTLTRLIIPWDGLVYVQVFQDIVAELEAIFTLAGGKGNVVCVVDNLFLPAVDAVRHLHAKLCLLSPNTVRELALAEQPNGAALWKFPAICSGYQFPVPWYLIPANIILNLCLIYYVFVSRNMREKIAYLKKFHPSPPDNFLTPFTPETPALCQTLPETDFPYDYVPSNITRCGPIFRLSAPLGEAASDLKSWLKGKKTLVVNLGSHVLFTRESGAEMAEAVKGLLRHDSDTQVLWKVKSGAYIPVGEEFEPETVLDAEIKDGSVRIVSWLPVEPSALLREAGIAAVVNHGGSGSWHEALAAGIPQVNLPVWADTYEFARRSEFLGVGFWGSRTSAPGYNARELEKALISVMSGEKAASMTAKARHFAALCSARGEGRDIAAAKILELL